MAEDGKPATAGERQAVIQKDQKRRQSRRFLFGLLAGQILVIGLDLGGSALLHHYRDRVRINAPIPPQSLVFIGMAAGFVVTVLVICLVLGIQATGWVFGRNKAGLFTAIGRGAQRLLAAGWILGLTLGVILGTAWFMIPGRDWKPTKDYIVEQGDRAVDKGQGWIRGVLQPKK